MTYLSKSQSFLASKATSLIGRTIVCTYDTGEGYFTKGKEYEIHKDVTGGAFLINNFGGVCHSSGSTFKLKQSPLTPKQPKVGEVWSFTGHRQFAAFHEDTLYYIVKIEDGVVYHKVCKPKLPVAFWTAYVFTAPIDCFLEKHKFVF